MFRTLNLGMLSLTAKDASQEAFLSFEKSLSGRDGRLVYRPEELRCIASLLASLEAEGPIPFKALDGFAYSYRIPQICEEIDLLRVTESLSLNIELKSQMVSEGRIRTQLLRKRHYLSRLGRKVASYAYVLEGDRLYTLQEGEGLREVTLAPGSFWLLRRQIMEGADSCCTELDALFDPSKFLISPLRNAEEFLAGEYFLTQQQDDFKKRIFGFFGLGSPWKRGDVAWDGEADSSDGDDGPIEAAAVLVEGGPGVGKTLLLFDVARTFAQFLREPVAILHCGPLQPEHRRFNEAQRGIRILAAHDVLEQADPAVPLASCGLVCLDEAGRLSAEELRSLLAFAHGARVPLLVSLDPSVCADGGRDMAVALEGEFGTFARFSLSSKVRTSREISRFTRALCRLGAEPPRRYDHVLVLCSDGSATTASLVSYWKGTGFEPLSVASDLPGRAVDEVLGLEFDDVLIVLDDRFSYDASGRLVSSGDGQRGRRSLEQALGRVRRGLVLVAQGNVPLFEELQCRVIAPGLGLEGE